MVPLKNPSRTVHALCAYWLMSREGFKRKAATAACDEDAHHDGNSSHYRLSSASRCTFHNRPGRTAQPSQLRAPLLLAEEPFGRGWNSSSSVVHQTRIRADR